MSEPTVSSTEIATVVSTAQLLQKRRESWKRTLDALPCPKVQGTDFPYGSLEAAYADDFKLFFGGKDEAFALLVKGFKTAKWRKGAEKNRMTRDDAADGSVSARLAKRVARKAAKVAKEAALEAVA